MFCRLGSLLLSRPVGAMVRLKVVCRRRVFIYLLRQSIYVGVLELGDFAVLGNKVNDRVQAAQFGQLAGGCGIAGLALFNSLARQVELSEQHVGQLARAS